jgi:hypothetical protein
MKNKNAIVYLLNDNQKDKNNFRNSIGLLTKNYLNNFPCDIICFHEQGFDKNEINLIKEHVKFNIQFEEINFNLPNYSQEILNQIPEYFPHPDFPDCQGFSIGYRHMCRFFAGEIFNQKILQKYDYVWRLDTDSFILDEIYYDIFSKMNENDANYGYINIQNDHDGVIKNLWETSYEYFKKIGDFKQFFETDKNKHFRKVYYTNFEIFKMSWFKSEEYQSFYKFIDESAGIYKYRWGDHVLRYIALNCLSDTSKCLFYKDIKYYHSELYFNRQFAETF